MKYFGESPNRTHIIALLEGEEIIQTVIDFCAWAKISSGFFQGVGAVSSAIIAHYNIKAKRYHSEIFNEPLEIVSLMGNIARKEGKVYVHCHGSFADRYLRAYGGHVKEAVISATGEIIIRETAQELIREPDERTGLNLLHSKKERDLKFPKHARGDIGP